MRMFEVGGCVRDSLLGIATKDIDFAVEMEPEFTGNTEEAFRTMEERLTAQGFTVFLNTPEFFTLRARFPKGHVNERLVADFVLCRKDGPSSNSRHPDFVEVGTLLDDLARRDFTMNAMARDMETGEIIDPFLGRRDMDNRQIRFVGNPMERLHEDALRALRAIRFCITKNMALDNAAFDAIRDPSLVPLLASVSKERMREELNRAFEHDTLRTFVFLSHMPTPFMDAILSDGLRLKATQEA